MMFLVCIFKTRNKCREMGREGGKRKSDESDELGW
jgi:hypothetical protein